MFESVVLRRKEDGDPISAGQIAEALLFYQKVHLLIDYGTLHQLVRQIGFSTLIELTQRSDFSAVYTEEMLCTAHNTVGPLTAYSFGAMTFAGDQTRNNLQRTEDRLQFQLEKLGCTSAEAKRSVRSFLARVPVRKLSGDHYVKGGIPEAARHDLLDVSYVTAAMRAALLATPGGYDPGEDLEVRIVDTELGIYVFGAIDFDRINRRRAAMHPRLDPVNAGYLLTNLLNARADLSMAAFYGGDFVCSSTSSAAIRVKHDTLLRRTLVNSRETRTFHEVHLVDMPTVAEAIDSGERTFKEFLRLLDKSGRFKLWLKSTNPDEGLVREYFRAATAEDWLQTSKSKGLRYAMATVADFSNPVVGIAAAITDNFIVDKLLGGWRPSHFVDDRLKPFLQANQK